MKPHVPVTQLFLSGFVPFSSCFIGAFPSGGADEGGCEGRGRRRLFGATV